MKKYMKTLGQVLFWLGVLSIPLSWLMWFFGGEVEVGKRVLGDIADLGLRAALQEAHAERWGLFVAVWPVTLLVLSVILEKKGAEVKAS